MEDRSVQQESNVSRHENIHQSIGILRRVGHHDHFNPRGTADDEKVQNREEKMDEGIGTDLTDRLQLVMSTLYTHKNRRISAKRFANTVLSVQIVGYALPLQVEQAVVHIYVVEEVPCSVL